MIETPRLDEIIKNAKMPKMDFESLCGLIEEGWRATSNKTLKDEQKNLLSEDFYANSLREMFAGID